MQYLSEDLSKVCQVKFEHYQLEGIAFLNQNDSAGLAFWMGLGKTLCALYRAYYLLSNGFAHTGIILAPKIALKVWPQESEKFFGQYLHVASSEKGKRGIKLGVLNVMTYQTFQRNSRKIQEIVGENVIFILDEAHTIKNIASNTTKAVLNFKATYKIALTGTPIVNKPDDIYALIYFLNPVLVGDYDTWARMFLVRRLITIKKKSFWQTISYQNLDKLQSIVDQVFLVRGQEYLNLPGMDRFKVPYEDNGKLYQNTIDLIELEDDPVLVKVIQIIQALGGLNPRTKQSSDKPCAKYNKLVELIIDEPIVVWFKFVETMEVVAKWLRNDGYSVYVVNGTLTSEQQEIQIKAWEQQVRGNPAILLFTIGSGGTGQNLVRSRRAIFYEMEWAPALNLQAEARIYRKGQTRRCDAFYIYGSGTVEEDILNLVLRKDRTNQAVIQSVTEDELKQIYKYKFKMMEKKGKKNASKYK